MRNDFNAIIYIIFIEYNSLTSSFFSCSFLVLFFLLVFIFFSFYDCSVRHCSFSQILKNLWINDKVLIFLLFLIFTFNREITMQVIESRTAMSHLSALVVLFSFWQNKLDKKSISEEFNRVINLKWLEISSFIQCIFDKI